MRLTLRTLLAYLDDRLPPANARELGQKISQSPFASDLVTRIREVVRRRRLAIPSRNEKLLDPNLLAEYLDDQLTPELVSLIEKEVLSSDFTLAEVAAAHQVIGLLGDPVPVEPRLKERLYGLNPNQKSEDSSGEDPPTSTAATAGNNEQWTPLEAQSTNQRNTPLIILIVLIAAWLGLIFTDDNLIRTGQSSDAITVAHHQAVDNDQLVADENDNQNSDHQSPKPETNEQQQTTVNQQDNTTDVVENNESDSSEAGSETMVTDTATEQIGEQTSPKEKNDPATNESTESVTENNSDPKAQDNTTEAALPRSYRYQLNNIDSMTMLCSQQTGEWQLASQNLVPGTDLAAKLKESFIAVSDPFRTEISTVNSGWRALLLGNSLAAAIEGDTPGLRLLDGRLILRFDPTRPDSSEDPITFRLLTESSFLDITLQGEDVVAAIAVTPAPLPLAAVQNDEQSPIAGLEPLPLHNDSVINIFVAEGAISIAGIAEQPTAVARGRALTLLASGTDITSSENATTQGPEVIPDWAYSAEQAPVPEVENLKNTVSGKFTNTASMKDSAITLTQDRNPQIALTATNILSVTRQLDDLAGLLLSSDNEVVRRTAIDGLRLAMSQTENNISHVRTVLETRLPGAEVEDVLTLLQGLTVTAAQDPAATEWIINLLDSDRTATRELAIYNIEQVTGERQSFAADADAGRRREAIRRWQRTVERNGGTLIKSE